MLEFCKNELKKQNSLAFALINVPNDNNLRQLSQLISNQKVLLESLISEMENPLHDPFFTDMQMKIGTYYNNYFQQQRLLSALGFANYLLPNLNPMHSELQNTGSKDHFFYTPNFVSSLYPPKRSAVDNNWAVRNSAPSHQSINKFTVSKSPAFFHQEQNNLYQMPLNQLRKAPLCKKA
ncbi:TPA: hypothetical protein ACTXXA_000648 [Legionella anisa]